MDWLQIAGAVFLTWLVLVFLFAPHINYHLSRRTSVHAEDFLHRQWRQRPLWESVGGPFVWTLERQQ